MMETELDYVGLPCEDDSELVLRVLSGVNRGAEARVGEGVWLIGAGDAADLAFADPELAASHIRLVIETDEIHVTALAPGVRIRGEELAADSSLLIDQLTPVQVGRTIFAVGPAGCVWPDTAAEADKARPGAARAASEVSSPKARARDGALSTTRRRLCIAAVACALLAVPVGVGWASLGRVPSSEAQAAPTIDPLARAEGIARQLGLSHKIAITQDDGKVAISGDLRGEDRHRLQGALHGAGIAASVVTRDPSPMQDFRLVDLATTVTRAYGIEGSAEVTGAGEITLKGYAPSDAKVDGALTRLRQDVPGLRKINDEIATPERARSFLEREMTADVRRSVRIKTKPDSVCATGTLTSHAYEGWQKVAAAFQEKFAPYIGLETQFDALILPPPVGVQLGRAPFVAIESGIRLKLGDSLNSIGTIADIDHDGIWLRIGNDKVHLPYPEKPKWIAEEAAG